MFSFYKTTRRGLELKKRHTQNSLRCTMALDAFLPKVLHFVPIPSQSLPSASEKQLSVLQTALCCNQTILLLEISLYGQPTGLELVKTCFGARAMFLRGTCADVSGSFWKVRALRGL